jgi:hypothetical protein
MTRNILMLAAVVGVLFAGPASTAFAGWTEFRTVTGVYLRPSASSSTPYLQITVSGNWGSSCEASNTFRQGDDRNQDHFVSMAMAAFLSGRPLAAYVSSDCSFSRLQIQ